MILTVQVNVANNEAGNDDFNEMARLMTSNNVWNKY
jgi:hypothetical protein